MFGPRGGAGWRWALVCLCNGSGTGAACPLPALSASARRPAGPSSAEQGVPRGWIDVPCVSGLMVILEGRLTRWLLGQSPQSVDVGQALLKAELHSQGDRPHTQVFSLAPSPRQPAGGVAAPAHQPPAVLTLASLGSGSVACLQGVSMATGCRPARAGPLLQGLHSGAQIRRLAWRLVPWPRGPVAREVKPGLGSVAVVPRERC